MTDQTAKADAGKARISLVPTAIIYAIARTREYGLKRYPEGGKDNWKRVDAERYRDALGRHFLAYIDEPYGVDRESGLPHLWHLATNCAFLCELDGEAIKQMDTEKVETQSLYGKCEGCKYSSNIGFMNMIEICTQCCRGWDDRYERSE